MRTPLRHADRVQEAEHLADPALVYDEEHDLFRFHDGKFAFSREHANWELLKKRGRLKGL